MRWPSGLRSKPLVLPPQRRHLFKLMTSTTAPQTPAESAAGSINPLLDFSGLPLFDRIQPQQVEPAVTELLAESEQALRTVTADDFPARWKEISATLDTTTERLGRAWNAVGHLNSVADTPELRAAYNAAMPKVVEFWTRLGADEALYAKYKAIDQASLNPEQTQAF